MRVRSFALLLAVLLFVVSATIGRAQAPDCTGISGVHNTDPDLFGELDTRLLASGLSNPIFVTAAPGDNERLFIVEQAGRIKILKDGAVLPTPFLNITSIVNTSGTNERGLLGLAFHPDYQTNHFFFVYYTATLTAQTNSGDLTVARYRRNPLNPDLAEPASAEIVINIAHPIANHNAGMIAFSPIDGHLYVGTGDGGGSCDPGPGTGNAQNVDSLLGKMLRRNVDNLPYTTAGNPFDGGTPGADEVWAYGLRNPWRWSFDRVTGAQYIGDVGQFTREELNCARPASTGGENYGWALYEGGAAGNPTCPPDFCSGSCPAINDTLPFRDYLIGSSTGRSVIGGYVYRGCRMPDLRGTYFYSDFYVDFVKTLRTDETCTVSATPDPDRRLDLEPVPPPSNVIQSIAAYGEDNQGELYMVDRGGELYKIIPEFVILEVSGFGVIQMIANEAGEFVWEDIAATQDAEVQAYKIYRADTYTPGTGPTGFQCEKYLGDEEITSWADPETPLAGQVFYYSVAAINLAREETVPGVGSDGTPRVVDTDLAGCFD
jgi:glucose/arabinose dehydrogenase